MRMRPLSIFGGAAAAMLICLTAAGMARAQDESNPPGRAAQLSYAEGSVSLEPAGTSSWTSATLNRPLTIGDKLWTDRDSRAELDIGDAVIRLGSTTAFSFLNLDEQTAQMQVAAGTAIVHVRSLSSGEHDEIDTPNLALTLEQPGTYRVQVSDAGDTTIVKVEEGAALATGGGQSFPVAAQQSVTFIGTTSLMADYATLGAPDSLDDWSMRRDQEEEQRAAVAREYVSPDVVGATDLGSYGTWESTPDWGYVWFPTVAVGWAPYSVGHWVWVSPWGWTWVDAEPWGFAPFHYGRWGYWHRRWCWIPGPRRKRPIYAPALVGWVGGRHGRVPGRIGAHVGWFPLGPHDVYVPGYHASAAYVRNINMANIRMANTAHIARVYEGRVAHVSFANSKIPGAVTAVPRSVFVSARPVAPHRVALPRRGGMSFRVSTAAPAITPIRQSVLGVRAGRVVRPPPRSVIDRPVVARRAPPRAPVSFAREQAAIRANGGRPLPMAELSRLRPHTPAAPVRLAPAPGQRRPGALELRTAPGNRPSRALRPNRPNPETVQPRQRPGQLEWRVPPQRQVAPRRQEPSQFVPPPRRKPEPRYAPPERHAPAPRSAPPPARPAPQPRYAPPQRHAPAPRSAPPARPAPQPRYAPPQGHPPPLRFAPPSHAAPREMPRPPAGHAAPARPRAPPPPPARPMQRPPRADAAPSFRTRYARQPPRVYRPVPAGHSFPAPLDSRRVIVERARRTR